MSDKELRGEQTEMMVPFNAIIASKLWQIFTQYKVEAVTNRMAAPAVFAVWVERQSPRIGTSNEANLIQMA